MQIAVLGPLALGHADGRAITLSGDRQRLLFALLASRVGSTVPSDTLVEALWGDRQASNPAAALHSQVARLRRALPAHSLAASEASGYRLDVPATAVDANRFEDLLSSAGSSPPAGDAEGRLHLLTEAVGLWRGDAYQEFGDVEALRLEATRLNELRVAAEERYGDALLAAGRPAEAIAHLERLVAAHPFREGPVDTLMRCYAAEGRQAEALRRFQTYRARLADELGLEPSPRLRRLDASIAVGHLSPGAPQTATHPGETGPATLEHLVVTYTPSARRPSVPIAVGRVGQGPRIVSVPAWVTSLDVFASSRDPRSALLERLALGFEVVAYDQPGTGLSRGDVTDFSVDAAADDLAAVIEHCGGEPVNLLAASAAGPPALALATRRPDLVRRLVLFGTYADPSATFRDPELSAALTGLVRARWTLGLDMMAQLYRPGASDDACRRLATALRDSAPADIGAEYFTAIFNADVSPLLSEVTQPALVIHYRGDRLIPFSGGEQLAASLPNARFVPLDDRYHLPDVTDTDRLARVIGRFIAET